MANVVKPFLVCQQSISISEWDLMLNDEVVDAIALAEQWSHASKLTASCRLSVNWDLLKKELQITQPNISYSVEVGTGESTVPWVVSHRVVSIPENNGELEITLDCHSEKLLSQLFIKTSVVLSDYSGGSELSPTNKGDVLWEHRHKAQLTQKLNSFPVLPIDFSSLSTSTSLRLNDNPWFIEWSPTDWEIDISAAIRLYINKENYDFYRRFMDGDAETLKVINADLIKQVCSAFIYTEYSNEDSPFFDGSLGWQAGKWIESIWSDLPINILKDKLINSPAEFNAECMKAASTT